MHPLPFYWDVGFLVHVRHLDIVCGVLVGTLAMFHTQLYDFLLLRLRWSPMPCFLYRSERMSGNADADEMTCATTI